MEHTILADDEIIGLYFARDERAITESNEKYGGYCFVIANNILSNEQDAEECVNDTWATSWTLMPPTRPCALGAFFGKISRNKAFDRYKASTRQKRCALTVALEELEDCASDQSVEDEVRRNELAALINEFLHSLPERESDMFICRYYHVYPTEEIARAFAIKENAVRSTLSRIRKKLRAFLERRRYL